MSMAWLGGWSTKVSTGHHRFGDRSQVQSGVRMDLRFKVEQGSGSRFGHGSQVQSQDQDRRQVCHPGMGMRWTLVSGQDESWSGCQHGSQRMVDRSSGPGPGRGRGRGRGHDARFRTSARSRSQGTITITKPGMNQEPRMDAKAQVQETEGSKLDDLNKGKRSASRMKMV